MVFKHIIISIPMIFIFLNISCSSVKGGKRITGEAIMYGMVYNDENIPVSNAEIRVDGRKVSLSDPQGRFILVSKQRKEFELTIVKSGHETVSGKFRFEPMEVIHFVMMSAVHLISRAELAMDEGRYEEVIAFCDRALSLNPDRHDATYLKALGLVRLREYVQAIHILEGLGRQIGEREYIRKVLEGIPE